MLAELKKRVFFWKRNKSRLENLPAEELRHIIAESDHISAVVESIQGLLMPEDMERLKPLTRTIEAMNEALEMKPNADLRCKRCRQLCLTCVYEY